MKLSKLIYEYLENHKFSIKNRTLIYYKQMVAMYIENESIDIEVNQLTTNMLNTYIKYRYSTKTMALAYSSIKVLKSIIARSLTYARNIGIYTTAVVNIVLKPRKNNIVQALTQDEQTRLVKYILTNNKYYSYGVVLSLYTGLRIGELLSLKWENVDINGGSLSITSTTCHMVYQHKTIHLIDTPKTQSSIREIPINKFVIKLLKTLKIFQNNNSPYVISRSSGQQICVRAYQDSFTRLLKRLKIRHYGFHSLRHTFATRCLESGVDIKTISEILGHSSPTITLNRYVHSSTQAKLNAINTITKKMSQCTM